MQLKRERERQRLTFAALAAKSGIHKATVARIERGEVQPMHKTVEALEDALGVKRGSLEFGQPESISA